MNDESHVHKGEKPDTEMKTRSRSSPEVKPCAGPSDDKSHVIQLVRLGVECQRTCQPAPCGDTRTELDWTS